MGWILALDTAGDAGNLTLAPLAAPNDAREFPLDVRQRHAQTLLPAIRSALTDCRLSPRDVTLIAVTSGPGSFTGLRVGIMAAKTWAWATSAQLVAIPSLLAIAETWRRSRDPISPGTLWCVENAQRGELFASQFRPAEESSLDVDAPIEIVSPADLRVRLRPGDSVTGPGVTLWTRDDSDLVDDLPPDSLAALRAASHHVARPAGPVLTALAAQFAATGRLADPLTLEPTYLRRSSAEDKWLAKQTGR